MEGSIYATKSGDDDHVAAIRKVQRALMTTVFDAAGKGSAKASWALMRRARADRFESASSAAKPSPFQRDASCKIKKPDMYWSAPRGAVRPVISAVEIGYVRRSEIDR